MTARGGLYRCRECWGDIILCKDCIVEAHQTMPFHNLEQWDEDYSYFKRVSPGELGLAIYCRHPGATCPLAGDDERHPMRIVDRNGLFLLDVYECLCDGAPEFWEQLLLMRLFPATYDRPETAFTFAVLKDCQTFNFAAKVSQWDYWGTVQRKTDGVQWKKVPVSTALCLQTVRDSDLVL